MNWGISRALAMASALPLFVLACSDGDVAERANMQESELSSTLDAFASATAWAPFACEDCSLSRSVVSSPAIYSTSLKLDYHVTPGGWAGVERRFATPVDLSGAQSLKLYIYGSGSGDPFLIQLYDEGNERWESQIKVTWKGWQRITFPLVSFAHAAWQPADAARNGRRDFNRVRGMSLSPSLSPSTGTLYVDSLQTSSDTTPTAIDAGSAPPTTVADAGAPSSDGSIGDAEPLPGAKSAGTIVALYTYPTDSMWNALVLAKQAHPSVSIVAIINPDSGPGTSQSSAFVSGIDKLVNAGIRIIGYVPTGYGARTTAAVQHEIDLYATWYPKVTGIFFDEMSGAADKESYYRGLTTYAKSKGRTLTVGNPGANVPESFVGSVDVLTIYENSGLPNLSSLASWRSKYAPTNFSIIPYNVPTLNTTFIANARQTIGYIYATNDTLPNPWDTLPTYFDGLLKALE